MLGNETGVLDKASATALFVNLPETLSFNPLVDHAERGQEQNYHNSHEAIDRRKRKVQGHICEGRDRRDTEVARRIVRVFHERLIRAESATNLREVGGVEVATALQLVLYEDARFRRLRSEDGMEIRTFLQRVEPHERSDDEDSDGVHNEDPVQNYETDSDMVRLDNGADGDGPRNKKRDSQHEARRQIAVANNKIAHEVRPSPDDGEHQSEDARYEEAQVHKRPTTHQLLGRHLSGVVWRF